MSQDFLTLSTSEIFY